MKKVLLIIAVIAVLSGCGNREMLTCTTDNTLAGITSTTTYNIEYAGTDVKKVTATYKYSNGHVAGVNTGTDGSTEDNGTTGNGTDTTGTDTTGTTGTGTTDANAGNSNNANIGVNDTRTPGVIEDNDGSDGIIGGAAGEALDDVVSFTTDSILDMAGIRTRHNARFGTYTNTDGFTTAIDTNDDDNYKVTYTYDMDKLSDDDINGFGMSKDYDTLRSMLTGRGLTCK